LCSEEHKHELALTLEFCTIHSDQIKNEAAVQETKMLIRIFIEQYFATIERNGEISSETT